RRGWRHRNELSRPRAGRLTCPDRRVGHGIYPAPALLPGPARGERELSAAYSQYAGQRKITHAANAAIASTMPTTAILRCGLHMLLTRSTVTRPHTPLAVTAPITTRARIRRRGK